MLDAPVVELVVVEGAVPFHDCDIGVSFGVALDGFVVRGLGVVAHHEDFLERVAVLD
jgi:hypothetical protein